VREGGREAETRHVYTGLGLVEVVAGAQVCGVHLQFGFMLAALLIELFCSSCVSSVVILHMPRLSHLQSTCALVVCAARTVEGAAADSITVGPRGCLGPPLHPIGAPTHLGFGALAIAAHAAVVATPPDKLLTDLISSPAQPGLVRDPSTTRSHFPVVAHALLAVQPRHCRLVPPSPG